MLDLFAITIAVNYNDIFKHMLGPNSKFFKRWFIVTSPDDKQTISLIKSLRKHNVKLLIYNDFYIKGSKFNKGGALKFAQEFVYSKFCNTNMLILDADILLPPDFMQRLPKTLDDNVLYGVSERLDYWSIEDYNNNKNPHRHPFSKQFIGFFQLYKQSSKYKYQQSFNCSDCDMKFKDMFTKKILLDLSVKHLGRKQDNWDGVVTKIT